MEGPNIRGCPRTLFSGAVEVRVGDKTTRLKKAKGDLGIHGLFLHAESFPVNAAVHLKIFGGEVTEIGGIVRSSNADGTHIEFTDLTEANRRQLEELIAEFILKEPLSR